MKAIGIDIGTTSICLACYDGQQEQIIDQVSAGNSFIQGTYLQDAQHIVDVVEVLLEAMLKRIGLVDAIGISSQMHGILYVDQNGNAVSPYYTWKTELGKEAYQDMTYVSYLTQKLGCPMHTGYGSVTHFALDQTGQIPAQAVSFVNIGDYVAMQLCHCKVPTMSQSIAASMGGYDVKTMDLCWKELEAAGVAVSFYPQAGAAITVAGTYRGILVSNAIGDNQASFYAAVGESEDRIGINVGTGSQVSLFGRQLAELATGEIRPFTKQGYLYVQASVNGGKVYEKLADFLREVVYDFTGMKVDPYSRMEKLGEQKKETDLRIIPSLYGAREDGENQGRIEGIQEHNFHPEDLIRGYAAGMAEELYRLYMNFPEQLRSTRKGIVGSGNGIRKNILLQQEIEKRFGLKVDFCDIEEEAAAGAAMMALKLSNG